MSNCKSFSRKTLGISLCAWGPDMQLYPYIARSATYRSMKIVYLERLLHEHCFWFGRVAGGASQGSVRQVSRPTSADSALWTAHVSCHSLTPSVCIVAVVQSLPKHLYARSFASFPCYLGSGFVSVPAPLSPSACLNSSRAICAQLCRAEVALLCGGRSSTCGAALINRGQRAHACMWVMCRLCSHACKSDRIVTERRTLVGDNQT